MKEWIAFMDKYYPDGDKTNRALPVYGYSIARTMVQVLKQCGDDLTRANVMKQAASLKDFETGMALPGVKINTSAGGLYPIEQMQMGRFNGESFVVVWSHPERRDRRLVKEIRSRCERYHQR